MDLIIHDYIDIPKNNVKKDYICTLHNGKNKNPKISWNSIPNAHSYAFIMEDLDAPNNAPNKNNVLENYIHWYIPYINIKYTSIDSNISSNNILKNNTNFSSLYKKLNENMKLNVLMGFNHHGTYGYFGPCAPSGTHRYKFKIYALDAVFTSNDGKIKSTSDFENQCKNKEIKILQSDFKIINYHKENL